MQFIYKPSFFICLFYNFHDASKVVISILHGIEPRLKVIVKINVYIFEFQLLSALLLIFGKFVPRCNIFLNGLGVSDLIIPVDVDLKIIKE